MVAIEVLGAAKFTAAQVDDSVGALKVGYTNDAGPAMTLEVPDDWDEGQIADEVAKLVRKGDLHLFADGRLYRRVEPLWTPQWIPPPGDGWTLEELSPLFAAGDTYPLHGITEEVKARGQYGRGVRVGHVDTWVDTGHPWFDGLRIVTGGRGQDTQSHGTHTLATICGQEGILNEPAVVYTFNCLPGGSGAQDLIAQGIDWCTDQGAQFISSSLGASSRSPLIDQSVQRARSRGVVFINAAGNSGDTLQPGSPAALATFQAMACDRGLHTASFSEGRRWSTPQRIYGEGVDVVSAFPGGRQGPASGTSMACPHIAGCVGLTLAGGLPAETLGV